MLYQILRGDLMENKLRQLCQSKTGSEEKYVENWGAFNFTVGDKMYAILGLDKQKKPIISLKCEPALSEVLRKEYEAINPGYYLNKTHWNSIYYQEDVPMELITQLIDESYHIVFSSLTKKKQSEILEKVD